MADGDINPLEIDIRTKADLGAMDAATAATSKLTAAQEKLANATIKAAEAQQEADMLSLRGIEQKAAAVAKLKYDPNRDIEKSLGGFMDSMNASDDNNLSKPSTFAAGATAAINATGNAAAAATPKIAGASVAVSRLSRMLGLPGLRAGAAMFTSIGAAAYGAYVIFDMVSARIKAIGDVTSPSLEPLQKAMENIREKTYQAEAAQRAYYRELERMMNRPETESAKAAVRLQIIQQTARFEEQMASQRHARDEQHLQALEDAGVISHAAALDRKLALDEDYERKRLASQRKAIDDELQAKKDELADDNARLFGSEDGRTKGATYELADAQNVQKATQKSVDIKQAELDQVKKDRDATVAKIAELEKHKSDLDLATMLPGTRKALQDIDQGKIDKEQENLAALNASIPELTRILHDREEVNNKASESVKELKSQVDELTSSIKRLKDALPHDESKAQLSKFQAGAESADKSYGGALAGEKNNAGLIVRGLAGNVSPADQKVITEMGAMIAGHAVTLDEAARLVAKANANNRNANDALNAMATTAELMGNGLKTATDRLLKINKDIADTNSRLNDLKSK